MFILVTPLLEEVDVGSVKVEEEVEVDMGVGDLGEVWGSAGHVSASFSRERRSLRASSTVGAPPRTSGEVGEAARPRASPSHVSRREATALTARRVVESAGGGPGDITGESEEGDSGEGRDVGGAATAEKKGKQCAGRT